MTDPSGSNSMPTQVTGSDGVVPIYNPDGLWWNWALQQLYLGTVGAQSDGVTPRYVGKVFDYVTDYTTNQVQQITALDPTTLIPTLSPIPATIIPPGIDTTDLLFGVGPGTQSDTYRCYIDQSVLPYKLTVDQRLRVNSVLTKYAKIFKGSTLTGTAQVISAFYDASGNFLGENVPLELVAMPNGQNYAVKTLQPCYTKVALADGDLVTAVFYADDGGVVSIRQLLAMNSGFIRSTDASLKYITGISLQSPFLSSSNPNQLQYPINVPLAGLNLMGVVHYSDGTQIVLPVDGTKFQVMGLADYVATIAGQPVPFSLKYNISPGEIIYSASDPNGTGALFKTEGYEAITQNVDGAYTLKLFCVPVYNTTLNQYRLEWYLYNLDRSLAVLVTPFVTYSQQGGAFQPATYGVAQALQVSIDISLVNGAYKKFIFTQTFTITLFRPATDHTGTPWTIAYDPGQSPAYGVNLVAKVNFINQNLKYVDISQAQTDQETWLNLILPPARPLYDPNSEASYPAPNMFSFVMSDGTETEFPISQWSAQNLVSQDVPDAATLYLKFFQRTPENDLQIALCPMVIQQTD